MSNGGGVYAPALRCQTWATGVASKGTEAHNRFQGFGLSMAKTHTILVVDDEPDVVKSVQDLLRLDYNVLGSTRAKEGLVILNKEIVDVIMTDQRMPEM